MGKPDKSSESTVVVNIFGEDYPIAGVTDPSSISKVADYVDSRMKEVARNSRISRRDNVAILAAMSIASELLEKSDSYQCLEQGIESLTDATITKLDEVLSH